VPDPVITAPTDRMPKRTQREMFNAHRARPAGRPQPPASKPPKTAPTQPASGRPRRSRRRPTEIGIRGWNLEDLADTDRVAAARQIVSILIGAPQPHPNAPAVLSHHGDAVELAQVEAPLSYRELPEHFTTMGWRDDHADCEVFDLAARKRKASKRSAIRTNNSGMSATATVRRQRKVPGIGGMQPRPMLDDPDTAMSGLVDALGPPTVHRYDGVEMSVFEVDPNGRGLVLARLSGAEAADGHKLINQVHDCNAAIKRQRRAPDGTPMRVRYVVATANNSGGRDYEERIDLQFLDDRIRAKEIDWIVARHPDRLARDDHARATLTRVLQTTRTHLLLDSMGRFVDWRNDKMSLQAMGMADERERELIAERTTRGHHSRVAEGKGWSTSPKFGFYKHPHLKDWHEDPDQWLHLRWLWHRAYELISNGEGGLRQLSRELEERGATFTPSYLGRLLRDPIYMTGERPPVIVKGRAVACKPVKLSEPIPADLFEAVKQLLAQHRGPHSRNPIGTHPFNGLQVIHARCGCGMKAREYKRDNTQSRLHHQPRVPNQCKGRGKQLTIDEDLFTRAVVDELLRLAECRELQKEWERKRKAKQTNPDTSNRRAQVERNKEKLARLEDTRDALRERWLDEVEEGIARDENDYDARFADLEKRIRKLRRDIEIDEGLLVAPPPSIRPPVDDPDNDLLQALRAALPIETPDDDDMRRQRAALIEACLSKIVIHDADQGVTLELHGPLAPVGSAPIGPLEVARPFLPLGQPADDPAQEEPHEEASLEADPEEEVGIVFNSQSENYCSEEYADREWLFRRDEWDKQPTSTLESRARARRARGVPSWTSRVALPTVRHPRKPAPKWTPERHRRWRERVASTDPVTLEARRVANARRMEGIRRHVRERGWAGRLPFAFRYDRERRRTVVDPDAWTVVEAIAYGFAAAGSLEAMAASLRAAGHDMSAPRVRRVLTNRIYVDGTWSVSTCDGAVAVDPIELPRPIPEEVFARNQQILKRRAGRSAGSQARAGAQANRRARKSRTKAGPAAGLHGLGAREAFDQPPRSARAATANTTTSKEL
jgi:DNA invertase Pin-like site-specific DNA recombinase